jgi:hypothetical protein
MWRAVSARPARSYLGQGRQPRQPAPLSQRRACRAHERYAAHRNQFSCAGHRSACKRLADPFSGHVDEFRTWHVQRSDGWIETTTFFVVTATLSNLGRFDSFVRAKGKVVVGTTGTKTPIEFIVEPYGEESTEIVRSQYISVESRKTKTVRFVARLEEDERRRVRAAYESGLVYVRLALLVSSGKDEKKIVSSLSPFSVEARKQHDEVVAGMTIKI